MAEQWGTVCEGNSWNNKAASVICSQLGFSRWGKLFNDVDSSRYHNLVYIGSHNYYYVLLLCICLCIIMYMFMYYYVYVYVLLFIIMLLL